MDHKIDWIKTKENINFLLHSKTHKNKLAEALGLGVRAVQIKLQESSNRLFVDDLVVLADYLECNMEELLIFEDDKYIGPDKGWKNKWGKVEVDDEDKEQVKKRLESNRKRKESYPIRDLAEFMLFLPLINERALRDVTFRCYEMLTYDHRHYLMTQLEYLYRCIPEGGAKREADEYRDNIVRVKGAPVNNVYSLTKADFNKAYKEKLKNYPRERIFSAWSLE